MQSAVGMPSKEAPRLPGIAACRILVCICVFVYLCICVFVYLCICVFVYKTGRQAGGVQGGSLVLLPAEPGQVIRLLMVLLENMEDEECGRRQVAWHCIAVACRILLKP